MRLVWAYGLVLSGALALSSCSASAPASTLTPASAAALESTSATSPLASTPTQVEYIPNEHLIMSMGTGGGGYWPVTVGDVDVTPIDGKRTKRVTETTPGGGELTVTGVSGTYFLVLDMRIWNRSDKTVRPWEELNLYLADETGQLVSEMSVSSSRLDGGLSEDSPLPSMNEGEFKMLFSVGHRVKPVYLVMSEELLGLYKHAVPSDEVAFLKLVDFGF
nr:hypothetical protein pA40H1_p11 [Arthrobacter sp.]